VTNTATCTRYENFFGVHLQKGKSGDGGRGGVGERGESYWCEFKALVANKFR